MAMFFRSPVRREWVIVRIEAMNLRGRTREQIELLLANESRAQLLDRIFSFVTVEQLFKPSKIAEWQDDWTIFESSPALCAHCRQSRKWLPKIPRHRARLPPPVRPRRVVTVVAPPEQRPMSEAQLGATLAAPGYDAQRSRPSAANDDFFRGGRGRGGATNGSCRHRQSSYRRHRPTRESALSCHAAPAVKHIASQQRGSVRQAVILREVLGPPHGLQALDDLGSF
jgi:hypothetical protein